MMKRYILVLLLCFSTIPVLAQKEVRQQVRQGNKSYKKKEYQKAEIDYRKALEVNPSDLEATYNLANTLYRTERGEEAAKSYEGMLKEMELLPAERAADVAHNAGNLMMAAKEYAKAIELYKESLRRRPADDETRYNLALAQKLLEQQESGGGENDDQQDQDDQQNQDKQQDQQDQNNQQDQQNPKEDENKDTKPKDHQDEREQQMSKSNAEKILEAYMQDEKETQRKIEQIKQQQQKKRRPNKKNW